MGEEDEMASCSAGARHQPPLHPAVSQTSPELHVTHTHTSTYTTGCLCIPGMNVFLSFFGKQIQKPWILLHNISIGLQCWKKDTPTVEAKASGTLVWRISCINCLMDTCIKTKGGLPSVVHCRILKIRKLENCSFFLFCHLTHLFSIQS